MACLILSFPDRLERARMRYEAVVKLAALGPGNDVRYRQSLDELLAAQREAFYGK